MSWSVGYESGLNSCVLAENVTLGKGGAEPVFLYVFKSGERAVDVADHRLREPQLPQTKSPIEVSHSPRKTRNAHRHLQSKPTASATL